MNLVDQIKDQLADGILSRLSAAIGESGEKTKAAVDLATAGLLTALGKLASNSQGAETLIRLLRQFDGDAVNRLRTDLAGEGADKIRDHGGDVLGSLLGGDLSNLVNVLSQFSGVGAVALKSLLSYLAPLVLSMIAESMKGKSLTPAGLNEFFNDQKANIQAALPAGFTIVSHPPVQPTTTGVDAPARSGWVLPLTLLALLGVAAWYFLADHVEPPGGMEPPAVEHPAPTPEPAAAPAATPAAPAPVDPNSPEPTGEEVNKSLDEIFKAASQVLETVKDAATAEAAASPLEGLGPRIDSVKAVWERLAPFGKAAVTKATAGKLPSFKALVDRTLAQPGARGKLETTLNALVARLSAFVADVSSWPTS